MFYHFKLLQYKYIELRRINFYQFMGDYTNVIHYFQVYLPLITYNYPYIKLARRYFVLAVISMVISWISLIIFFIGLLGIMNVC
jgi:hypothetical protein